MNLSATQLATFQTPASILAAMTPDQISAHMRKLTSHLNARQEEQAKYGKRASNTKVMNRIKRELAALETLS
jgi:hypothetical protein